MKESNFSHHYEKIVPIAVKLDPDMQRDQIMALAELFLELKNRRRGQQTRQFQEQGSRSRYL